MALLPRSVLSGQSNAPQTASEALNYTTFERNVFGNEHPSVAIDATQAAGVLKRFRFPFDLPKYHTYIIESEVGSVSTGTSNQLTPQRQYKLPLPSDLSRTLDVAFDQSFNYLDMITRGVSAAAAGAVVAGLQVAAGRAAPVGLRGAAARGVAGALNVVGGIASAIGNENVRRTAGAATGLAINNFKAVTLSMPRFQEFTLAWKLSPKTYEESVEIQKIVHSIQRGMHPEGWGGAFGTYAAFAFPKVYSVGIIPNSKFLMKFKPAVIQSFKVDYQAGNPAPAFYATPADVDNTAYSPPESVILSMSFLELEYWLQQDFDGKNDDGGLPSDNPFISNWFDYRPPSNTGPFGGGGQQVDSNGEASSITNNSEFAGAIPR